MVLARRAVLVVAAQVARMGTAAQVARLTPWSQLRVVVVAATAAVRQVAQQPGANQVALPVVTIIRELVAAQLGRVYSQTVKPGQMVVVDRARVVDPARLQAV